MVHAVVCTVHKYIHSHLWGWGASNSVACSFNSLLFSPVLDNLYIFAMCKTDFFTALCNSSCVIVKGKEVSDKYWFILLLVSFLYNHLTEKYKMSNKKSPIKRFKQSFLTNFIMPTATTSPSTAAPTDDDDDRHVSALLTEENTKKGRSYQKHWALQY